MAADGYEYIPLLHEDDFDVGGVQICKDEKPDFPVTQTLDSDTDTNIQLTSDHYQIKQYAPAIQKLKPSGYNATTSEIYAPTFELLVPKVFNFYEGMWKHNAKCKLCPYYANRQMSECDYLTIRVCTEPLDAYCLDGMPSTRVACNQNQLVQPMSWYGEFYYPDQKEFTPKLGIELEYYGLHKMYGWDMTETQKRYFVKPTLAQDYYKYGMTRRNTILERNYFLYNNGANIHNDDVQDIMVKEFRQKYTLEGHTWGLWLQSRCDGFCHRDSLQLMRQIQASDYSNDRRHWYLQVLSNETSIDLVCFKCLNDTEMVYTFDRDAAPHNKWWMAMWKDCRPWFGAVPVLNALVTNYPQLKDEVSIPSSEGIYPNFENFDVFPRDNALWWYRSELCPVNTYNRICDHTKAYQARPPQVSTFAQPQCTPCPSGYHTDGNKGSWYCLPPAGKLLVHRTRFTDFWSDTLNVSKVWARRDIIQYEFECGITPSDCFQCGTPGLGTSGFTPDQFNEAIIFAKLLEEATCEANKYCPHPLQDPIACPVGTCSPPGSHLLQNCSCCPGYYMSGDVCVPCEDPSTCSAGQYRQGHVECKTTIGPKSPQNCVSCTSVPANAIAFSDQSTYGIEIGTFPSNLAHFCPFRCDTGYRLQYNSGSIDACLRTYTCQPATPALSPYPFGTTGSAFIAISFYNAKDEVKYVSTQLISYCLSNTDFTSFFSSWTASLSVPNVLTSCAGQCGAPATTACRVSQNATLFQNFNCSPCLPANPLNSVYTSAALLSSTSNQAAHCSWQCNDGFYRDSNSQCLSCSALAATLCDDGYVIRGNGCSGDPTPYATLTAANCFNCSTNLNALASNQYLDVALCSIRNCSDAPALTPNNYYSKKCGGGTTGIWEQQACAVCQDQQYEAGACVSGVNRKCESCTSFKLGFFKKFNCTGFQDATWDPCPANSWCPGSGEKYECPPYKESQVQSASEASCYCKFGLEWDGATQTCKHKICPNSSETYDAPSMSYNLQSLYYLHWDPLQLKTECRFCSMTHPNVYAKGNRRTIETCRCPSTSYAPSITANTNVTCAACATRSPATCTPTGFYVRLSECVNGPATCECILPPFAVKQAQICPASSDSVTCDSPAFIKATSSGGLSFPTSFSKNVTGSHVYTTTTDKWSKAFDIKEFPLYRFRTTSDVAPDDYSNDNTQYVLFMHHGNLRNIYVQRVRPSEPSRVNPCLSAGTCSPYSLDQYYWPVVCPESYHKVVNFFVYAWPQPIGSGYFFQTIAVPLLKTWLGALVLESDTKHYYAYLSEMEVLRTGDVRVVIDDTSFAQCGFKRRFLLDTSILNSSTVDIVEVSGVRAFPGMQRQTMMANNDTGFFVAYNNGPSGGVLGLYNNATGNLQTHLNLSSQKRILSIVMYDAGVLESGMNLYVIFSDFYVDKKVKFYSWTTRDPGTIVMTDGLFFRDDRFNAFTKFYSFAVAWSKDSLVHNFVVVAELASRADDVDNATYVFSADTKQQTLVEIQGMPAYTSPRHAQLYEISSSEATLWASGRSGLYSLSLKRCPVLSSGLFQYWDGQACRPHHCIRRPPCEAQQNKVYNSQLNDCVCKPGYYANAGLCKFCEPGFYCSNNVRTRCSPATLTSLEGSSISQNCTCSVDGYFFDSGAGACVVCPKGSFCPDKWNKHACPGSVNVPDSTQGSQYPMQCPCLPGFEGAGCTPCPAGKKCPASTPLKIVTNYAVRLEIKEKQPNALPDKTIETLVCQSIKLMIKLYFETSAQNSFFYMKQDDTLTRRYFCQYYRSADLLRHESYFIIMIQVDDSNADVIRGLFTTYQQISDLNTIDTPGSAQEHVTYLHTVPRPTVANPYPPSGTVSANADILCAVGETPNPARDNCICRSGFELQTLTGVCTACRIGTFKAATGFGSCEVCPFQTTTNVVGSSACTSTVNPNATDTAGGGSALSSSNLYIIIGGAVGGVVIAVVFIFVYYYCFVL